MTRVQNALQNESAVSVCESLLPHLVLLEGVDEACIDVVDGDAENHNDHILGDGFGEGVSVLDDHGHVGRRSVHFAKTEVRQRHEHQHNNNNNNDKSESNQPRRHFAKFKMKYVITKHYWDYYYILLHFITFLIILRNVGKTTTTEMLKF